MEVWITTKYKSDLIKMYVLLFNFRLQFKTTLIKGSGHYVRKSFEWSNDLFCSTALLKCAFRSFDTDGNGQIDRGELANVFKSVNKQFNTAEIDKMMATVDTDKSGTLNYEEFLAAVEGKLLWFLFA